MTPRVLDLALDNNCQSPDGYFGNGELDLTLHENNYVESSVLGKMRNAEGKMWIRKCGMTLIGRGVKTRGTSAFYSRQYFIQY